MPTEALRSPGMLLGFATGELWCGEKVGELSLVTIEQLRDGAIFGWARRGGFYSPNMPKLFEVRVRQPKALGSDEFISLRLERCAQTTAPAATDPHLFGFCFEALPDPKGAFGKIEMNY